ncbi:MAG TPA: isoprenylcysteine carboxylmethyltransferase family protein [bacterium]|nr:isoprenylcysteine carboxylmethyltransferase family protein [bacterium]
MAEIKERKGEHPFGDAAQLVMLGVFAVVWIGDSFVLHLSTQLAHWVPLWVRVVFLGLAVGVAVRLVSVAHVVVSAEERPAQVMTTGAFRYVRHPIYLASLLGYLGLAVSTLSLSSLVLWIIIFGVHDYLASYEEGLLEAKFGDAYRAYKRETGKWLPRWR